MTLAYLSPSFTYLLGPKSAVSGGFSFGQIHKAHLGYRQVLSDHFDMSLKFGYCAHLNRVSGNIGLAYRMDDRNVVCTTNLSENDVTFGVVNRPF